MEYRISRILFNFSDLVPKLHMAGCWKKDHSVLLWFLLPSHTLTAQYHRDWNRIRWTLGIINKTPFLLPRSGMLDPSRSFHYLLFWGLFFFLLRVVLILLQWLARSTFKSWMATKQLFKKILCSNTASRKHYCSTTWLHKQKPLSWMGSRALPPALPKLSNLL